MNEVAHMPPQLPSKYGNDPLKNDWNDFQHLATQGRYLARARLSGLPINRFKLASVKKQLYNPRLPTIRHMERDDVLCRLPDEHTRHTTALTEDLFENFDPSREDAFVEFFGLNWHDTGKSLMGSTDCVALQPESTPVFGARLRPDKSQIDTRPGQGKIYRSPSVSCLSPSATLTKPIKYSYRNYGSGTFDQSTKFAMWPRFHMNTKNSFDSINRMPLPNEMQNVFRSSSMHAGVSTAPWKPSGPLGNNSDSKANRV